MFIELLQQDEICILRFQGRFTAGAQLEYLEDKLDEIRNLSASKVLADFSEVTAIGSTGLGFVVSIFASVTNRPYGRFVMTGCNPTVRKAFDVTRLSEIVPIAPDADSAMAMLRQTDSSEPAQGLTGGISLPHADY